MRVLHLLYQLYSMSIQYMVRTLCLHVWAAVHVGHVSTGMQHNEMHMQPVYTAFSQSNSLLGQQQSLLLPKKACQHHTLAL